MPGRRQKLPLLVRIDVDHDFHFLLQTGRGQERNTLRAGSPKYRISPFAVEPLNHLSPMGDLRLATHFEGRCQCGQLFQIVFDSQRRGRRLRAGTKVRAVLIVDVPEPSFFKDDPNVGKFETHLHVRPIERRTTSRKSRVG